MASCSGCFPAARRKSLQKSTDRSRVSAYRWLFTLSLMLHAALARAELWTYVDAQGHSHVADRQLDARYTLFFKGATTLDAARNAAADRASAAKALAGTSLYKLATDPVLARRFETLFETNARANGLDPALVRAVVAVESAFEPGAISDKGAVGLMQVLPQTGERYGVTGDAHRTTSDKLLDPATNVRVGTRYLRDLLARFANDLTLALAAYNAGEGTVESHHDSIPPFSETRDYVKLVQQFYTLYRPPPAAPPAPVRIIRRQHGQPSRLVAP